MNISGLSHFQQYFSYIVAVSFIGRGNLRKLPTCCQSLTKWNIVESGVEHHNPPIFQDLISLLETTSLRHSESSAYHTVQILASQTRHDTETYDGKFDEGYVYIALPVLIDSDYLFFLDIIIKYGQRSLMGTWKCALYMQVKSFH